MLAWSVGDFTDTTQSTTWASPGAAISNPAVATAGEYLGDSQAVAVTSFSFLPPSDYQFGLYEGAPPGTCPASVTSTQGTELTLTSTVGSATQVFESRVISTSANSTNPYAVTSTNQPQTPSGSGLYQIPSRQGSSYFWIASYYDTVDHITIFSPCASELVHVISATPSISTTLSFGSVYAGSAVHDSASLTVPRSTRAAR